MPVVILTPLTVDIENGGSQSFSFTVTDDFGHPLAHGNKYSVIVETKGTAGASGDVSITIAYLKEFSNEDLDIENRKFIDL